MTRAKSKRKPTSSSNDSKTKTHNSERQTTARKAEQLKPARLQSSVVVACAH